MTPAAFVSAFIPRWHSASQRASVASLKSAPPIPRVPVRRRRRLHHASPAMVLTPSTMLPLGTIAPLFSLPEPLSGRTLSIDDVKRDNGLLVIFMCNHCPFVKFVQDLLNQLGTDMKDSNVGMVGISSNDVNDYPDDNAENMAKLASTTFSTFHYLLDETQQVAKSYRAACTPDIYLFDKDLKLVYRGQLDDSRPSNGKTPTGKSIREAVKLLLGGEPIPKETMKPSIGCNIKWTKGNEPDYFG